MIVTEQEARTKWCPHARVGNAAGCNRDIRPAERKGGSYGLSGALCVASECMAWKWKHNHSPEEQQEREKFGLKAEIPKGYCGL